MTEHQTIDEKTLEGIAFVGRTLGPLFRYDPLLDREKVEALYVALARSNPTALCEEWPFVASDEVLDPITAMVGGAKRFEDELAVDNESLAATSSLADEYRRLFVGPAKKTAAPWGSVYTDRDQVVFGLSTLELREWLRKNGTRSVVANRRSPKTISGRCSSSWRGLPTTAPSCSEITCSITCSRGPRISSPSCKTLRQTPSSRGLPR